jgi:hypothetical protein
MEHFTMTHPTAIRRLIPWCLVYVASLAMAGCEWLHSQPPQPPAGSYRAQDFEVRPAGATEQIKVKGAAVSDEFFAGEKIRPMLGRTILPSEHQSMQVAVISYRLWNNSFHADPAALGRTFEVNGQNVTIVGVMPKDFSVPDGAQLWVPLTAR